ncbi:ParB/RepB/Spo0J family partition protein [Kitasatospora sp. LaBMicrA B282]|uniref:ParB/RepB/Spo0J family partition protein n=1 Tax=Kitasatospora sp. LaBMicrA B282 TaxID=3420949 RepID=UPI003D0F9A2B
MTRVADRVGAGAFGGLPRSPRSERGRAKAVAEGTIPDYELQRLALDRVAPCPMNPRRNFGTDEQKTEFGNSIARKQTTACVAVTREAYLKLWPKHVQVIAEQAEHVLLNGERRYRSALHVGLDALDFVVRDDLAASRADFLDYLMIENEERSDFDVIERARGLKQLLEACDGNAAEVARRRGKDRSWVGNQIALLTLPYAVQAALASGELAERYGRRLARTLKEQPHLDADALLDLAEQFKDEERTQRAQDRSLRELAKTAVLSADNIPTPVPAQASLATNPEPPVLSADNISAASGGSSPMLSTDNISDPVPAPTSPVVLSADNTPGTAPSVSPMLSADNIDAPTPHPSMLSADNIPTPPAASSPTSTRARARDLVRALGRTAAERAAVLREGSTPEELAALITELTTGS